MSGKNYRELQHDTTRRAIKTIRSSLCSLLDKGYNEGVEGIDNRVIDPYPSHNVDVYCMCNHKITSISLETTGGTRSTISGEFLLIMHKYAYNI